MKVNMYSFLDTKTSFFLPPMFYHNNMDAMRGVIRISKMDVHPICQFPEDYHLYLLATWDDNTGKCESLDEPLRIATVTECLGDAKRPMEK